MGSVFKVVLDAGHGKETAGKRSFDETFFEYEFNRYVTDRIKYHLERHGISVILTAPTDEDISLTKRCQISNNEKPNLFVSIHANAFGSDWNEANGWEIYVCGLGGNAEKLAKAIHKESIPYLGLKDRGIKVNKFTVIEKTNAPAVLIEHGFYTNKIELEKLKDKDFREKCAIVDTKGILKHLGIEWVEDVEQKVSILDVLIEQKLIINKSSEEILKFINEITNEWKGDV